MASMGSFKVDGLKEFQKELSRLEKNSNQFAEACARELAARLLRKVIQRTPVGDYSKEVTVVAKRDGKKHKKGESYTKKISHKTGGTLRRGWTTQDSGSGSEGLKSNGAAQYVESLKINHYGDTYVVEIKNPEKYASYVEYGHRKINNKGWVKGHFMMTISEQELQQDAPVILERKIEKYLRGVFR